MEDWGLEAGQEVELRGLSKLELNGQRGTVMPLESPEQARELGRLAVRLHNGKTLSLKVENLEKVSAARRGAGELSATSRKALRRTVGPQFTVLTFNVSYLAHFPKDPSVARRRLSEIVSGRPDVIALQEALEGIDLLAPLGYAKLVSSAAKAPLLREALYADEKALEAVPEVAHESLMVNELYLRKDCSWRVEGTGVEQISSAVLGDLCLAPRSVVWAKLRIADEGPCVFVMNTQLSGSRIEGERFLSLLAHERRRQVARAVELYRQHSEEEDLGLLLGDFGDVSGPQGLEAPEAAEAPLEALKDLDWTLAYDQSVVPASCLMGFLSDYMATSRACCASVQALATADVIGEASLDVPMSDHRAIQAAFPLTRASEGLEEMPLLGFGSHFLPEDLQEPCDEAFYRRLEELTDLALHTALRHGVRLLDSGTRHMNQQSLGRALQKALEKGVVERRELFLCGRIYKCKDKEQIREEVEMLLRELRVDYVDVLIADCPPEQTFAAWPFFEEAARRGQARALGVANFDLLGPKVCAESFRRLLAAAEQPPALLALEVHPLNSNQEMCELCRSCGIQVLAYAPLGSPGKVECFLQGLAESDARELRPLLKVPELRTLQQLAERHGKTASQVALRWNLQRGHSVVPKSWDPRHIKENTELFDFELSSEEMCKIDKLHKGVRSERFYQGSFTACKALPQMTRDAFDECQEILKKIRGTKGDGKGPTTTSNAAALSMEVAQRGGHDGGSKVDWQKLGFHRPVEEEPGFWRRMGLATGKGIDGGKGKGQRFPLLKDGLPVGGKGVPPVGYR